jgi:hypothetical protein
LSYGIFFINLLRKFENFLLKKKQSIAPKSSSFRGCWCDICRQGGGQIFTTNSMDLAPAGHRFAVCPAGLVPGALARLRRAHADFAAAANDATVTVFWLDCCMKARTALDMRPLRPTHLHRLSPAST